MIKYTLTEAKDEIKRLELINKVNLRGIEGLNIYINSQIERSKLCKHDFRKLDEVNRCRECNCTMSEIEELNS